MFDIAEYIEGKCMQMCPTEEVKMRQRERLLHVLEIKRGTETDILPKADENRAVKCFSRSAAGKILEDPYKLRPPDVLLETVNYLLDEVISETKLDWVIVYDFVMDRLRAVRQDMVIQNISRGHWISILQPIVRFHAYAAYRLCNEPTNVFDPYINNTHLQECLKRLLCMYDDCDHLYKRKYTSEEFHDYLIENRPHFEALYIIWNLGNTTAILRALNLTKIWKAEIVTTALNLSLYYMKGNFDKTCKIIKKLPSLLAAVASLHLPEIRRKVFQTMSVAYNNKNLSFPLNVLQELLLYDSTEVLISDCRYYGFEIKHNGVVFLKTSYKKENTTICARHEEFVEQKLFEYSLSSLVLIGE